MASDGEVQAIRREPMEPDCRRGHLAVADPPSTPGMGLLVVCTSSEAVKRFVADRGWSHDRIEQELTAAIVRVLCPAKMTRRACLEVPSWATTMRP